MAPFDPSSSIDRATLLYYSDDPEKLSRRIQGHTDGVLFDFDLLPGPAQRLVIYHVNVDPENRTIALRFLNETDTNARIAIIESIASPSTDYLAVGHQSTFGFIRALSEGSAKTIDIEAKQNAIATTIILKNQELASGFFELILVAGSRLRVSVIAVADQNDILAAARAGETFLRDGFGRRGKYDISDKDGIVVECDATKPTVLARIGERKFANLDRNSNGTVGNVLKGEYGIFTRIEFTIKNPTDAIQKVALYQSPHGGESTASYLVDGIPAESRRMPCVEPNERYKLARYEVPPRTSCKHTLLTMPDNASNSPVVLMLDRDDDTEADPESAGSLIVYHPLITSEPSSERFIKDESPTIA